MVIRVDVCVSIVRVIQSAVTGPGNSQVFLFFFAQRAEGRLHRVCTCTHIRSMRKYGLWASGRMFGKKTETRAVRRDMPFVYVGGACTYQHRRLEVVSRRVRDREHTAAHGNVGAARVGGRGPAGFDGIRT